MALRTESNFTNHDGGDLDSAGVLQQRPSQGWTDVKNPEHAMRVFMERVKKARHGKGAEVLAQDVQRSRCTGGDMPDWCGGIYGGNYKKHEAEQINLINKMRKESAPK